MELKYRTGFEEGTRRVQDGKEYVASVVTYERMSVQYKWNGLGDFDGVLIPVLSKVVGRRLMLAAARTRDKKGGNEQFYKTYHHSIQTHES